MRRKIMAVTVTCALVITGGALVAVLCFAGAPELVNFQGKLTDDSGNPLTGTYDMTFKLWDALSGGSETWSETWADPDSSQVTVTDGLYNVLLGSVNTGTLGSVFEGNDTLYLEITVGTETLSPRVRMGSAGYALRADDVTDGAITNSDINASANIADSKLATITTSGKVSGTAVSGGTLGTVNGSNLTNLNGSNIASGTVSEGYIQDAFLKNYGDTATGNYNFDSGTLYVDAANNRVGIGKTGPSYKLDVDGSVKGENSTGHGVFGVSTQSGSAGVRGYNIVSGGIGVEGVSTNGVAVSGSSTNGWAGYFSGKSYFDNNVGILETNPTYALDVNGTVYADGGSSYGVYGNSDSGRGTAGFSNSNYGVFGWSSSNYGVYGESSSGTASVMGNSSSSTHGVFGNSGSGRGVFGSSSTGTGGHFKSTSGYGLIVESGNVGIFETNPSYALDVNGTVYADGGSSGSGVSGVSTSYDGVYGQSSSSYAGVHGHNSGGGDGVFGRSDSGIAIYGYSASGHAGWFHGVCYFDDDVGIGKISPSYKLHVEGSQSGAASSGNAVGHFKNTVTSEDAAAVYGECANTDFYGVGGYFKGGYVGVKGEVFPTGTSGYTGVVGIASGGSGTNRGVYGEASGGATNYAGYFSGNLHCTGTLSKGGGTFTIDHPLDPENKILNHSLVESPDMKNVYDGVAVLDGNGEATVELPEWFEALNRDYRYQLTAIGKPAPDLYIKEEISENRFKIAGGEVAMKVSWQVTGIRQDAYANAHRILVEEDKSEKERGYYLHPEEWGQVEEKGVEWTRDPERMKKRKEKRDVSGEA